MDPLRCARTGRRTAINTHSEHTGTPSNYQQQRHSSGAVQCIHTAAHCPTFFFRPSQNRKFDTAFWIDHSRQVMHTIYLTSFDCLSIHFA